MVRFLLLFALCATPALAQAPPPVTDPVLMKNLVQALREQRDGAANEAAFAEAQRRRAQDMVDELSKENRDLQKQIDELKKGDGK